MIRNTKNDFAMEGDIPTIMTDLTVIIRNINSEFQKDFDMTEDEVKDMVKHCVDLAFKPYDEIKKDALEKFQKMMGDVQPVFCDFLKAILGIDDEEKSEDKSDADFKVWCETNDIRDKVLKHMEDKGIVWIFGGEKPTEWKKKLRKAPMGLIVDSNRVSQLGCKGIFETIHNREIKAEDLIEEVEVNE